MSCGGVEAWRFEPHETERKQQMMLEARMSKNFLFIRVLFVD
jgi:hypothetical protein